MILEELMLDLMYYLPSYKKVREFLVTKEMVLTQKINLDTTGKSRLSSAAIVWTQEVRRTAGLDGSCQITRYKTNNAYFERKIRYKTICR